MTTDLGEGPIIENFGDTPVRLNADESTDACTAVDGPEDIEALNQACDQAGIGFEHWTASIRRLCKACSDGRPHERHDRELKGSHSWERIHRVGFAAHGEGSLTAVLKGWADRRRRVADLRCTLDARLS